MKYLSSPKKIFKQLLAFNFKNKDSIISLILYISLSISFIYPFLNPKKANATVTQGFVRIDRHGTLEAISGSACIKTTTSGTETNVTIVFPADWTISSTASNWVANNTNLPYDPTSISTQATLWPGITNSEAAASVNGNSVTWAGSDISSSTTFYCFNFTGASSTIGAAGNNKIGQLKTQGGSPYVDTIDWATSVVTADADQITVTASVSAQLTFSLSSNTAALGTLSSSTTTAASGINQTVSTNARNGWASWIKSETNGGSDYGALQSSVAGNAQIDSVGTYDNAVTALSSTGGYVLDVDVGSGCDTTCVADEYETANADSGGILSYNIFRQTANDTTPTSGDIVSLVVKARSSATTPAASDYTDTLTVVAAGSF